MSVQTVPYPESIAAPGVEPLIRAVNLRRSFGDVVAVRDVSFEVMRGEVLGVLGPNGAGKSVTLKMLTTLIAPTSGTASICGFDVVSNAALVRQMIGVTGQDVSVDRSLTGHENLWLVGRLLGMSKVVATKRADELLDRFELSYAAKRMAGTYSGGMRRRLDLAVSLVGSPPVLFLDEPTTGLDPTSRTNLWGVIHELVADGMTVLLTTQYLEEAEALADRIIVIGNGEVLTHGTPTQLKSQLGAGQISLLIHMSKVDLLKVLGSSGTLGFEVEVSDVGSSRCTATIPLADLHGAMGLLATLHSRQVPVVEIETHQPNLDDVFTSVTQSTHKRFTD